MSKLPSRIKIPSWPGLRRRLLKMLAMLGLGWLAVTVGLVLMLRFVPPVASAVMVTDKISAQLSGRDSSLYYQWTPWKDISPQMPLAVVAAEDQHFPAHHGFDFASIRQALLHSSQGRRLRGASTISQQVAKNLFLWHGRSWLRKGLEVWFTVVIETLWPKQRILEVYLNIAEFGPGVYGVGAASKIYFDTLPERLDARQASLLAAVLPNPRVRKVRAPSAQVVQRAAWIRRQMRQLGGVAYVDFK